LINQRVESPTGKIGMRPIELNLDINILLGINGGGKSNFLKAIHLLQESIAGNGLEKIFLKEWGGFASVANFNQEEKGCS